MPKIVITYGTYDLFHVGHLNLLGRLRSLGDRLIVAVSTDEFNATKGKRALIPYRDRAAIVSSIRYVDMVIPETSWAQKEVDIHEYGVHVFGMGSDWTGKFDHLSSLCEVVYLPRTEAIASSDLRRALILRDQAVPPVGNVPLVL